MDANERRERATQEAAQWWNRLNIDLRGAGAREVSRQDREQFTQWLSESPLHVAELLRIAQVHDALERFKLWNEVEVDVAAQPDNVIALRDAPEESAGRRIAVSRSSTTQDGAAGFTWMRSRKSGAAIAAGVCLMAILGVWLSLGTRGQWIETDLAERRQVMLDDGTVVQLEPETRLRVRFADHRRSVAFERGRALFRVAKDPRRPFWVSVDHTSVRAVGTAFGVESGQHGVIVTVAEGKVAVTASHDRFIWPESVSQAPAPGQAAAAIYLTAGQQVTVRNSGTVRQWRTVDAGRALAWARGQLVFENDTLADVVQEFNRYNRTQLSISDSRLAARRVSGVFEATDTETLLAFIRQGGGAISVQQTANGIVIGSSDR